MSTLFAAAPTILGGIGAAKALKSSTPKAPPAIPMPDPEAVKRDQRRKYASAASRGRASTVLTDPIQSEGLG